MVKDAAGRSWEIEKSGKTKRLLCNGKECGSIGPRFGEKDLKDHVARENKNIDSARSRENRERKERDYEAGKSSARKEREKSERSQRRRSR